MVCDLLCCGQCCGVLSAIGALFLIVISAIINSGSPAILVRGDHVDTAAVTCLKAAAIYGAFVILSLMCYVKGKMNQKSRVVIEDPRSAAREKADPGTVFHTIRQDRKAQIN
eukprot:gb/GEZN01016647.1/.p1 GENE.gb/GEZN01016647.1/~~gb/GEZN01016647.1/.p1  ORF type:complete len:112 (-),score=5.61 gb/GEZN01016647.1/:447-782(-)